MVSFTFSLVLLVWDEYIPVYECLILFFIRNLLNSLLLKLGPLSVERLFGVECRKPLNMFVRTVIKDAAVFLFVATVQTYLEWCSITCK